ncbi:MAG: enolase C-terminal domain-like protein [Rhizobiaceae bacterium]
MKITRIRAFAVEAPMRVPYITAVAEKRVATSVLAVMETDDGVIGYGQSTTSATLYSPFEEFQDSIVEVVEKRLAPALIGANPFDLEALHERMQRVARGHLYAHATIDLACHDIIGKASSRPVVEMIGGAVRESIPLCAPHLGILPSDELAAQAKAYVDQGFRFINLRVGADLENDVANVSAVRAAIGEGVYIGVDFSQSLQMVGFRADTAIVHIRALEKAGANAFEQPVANWDIEGLARISAAIDSPIIADEAVRTPQDALRIVDRRAADAVKIKLMKVGGILPARKIAAILQAAGIPMTVGNGLAGYVANSAEAHFAFSIPNLKLPGEMNGFIRLEDDLFSGDLRAEGGDLVRPTSPGLGVTASLDKIISLAA